MVHARSWTMCCFWKLRRAMSSAPSPRERFPFRQRLMDLPEYVFPIKLEPGEQLHLLFSGTE